jgi:hypothetical protein
MYTNAHGMEKCKNTYIFAILLYNLLQHVPAFVKDPHYTKRNTQDSLSSTPN